MNRIKINVDFFSFNINEQNIIKVIITHIMPIENYQ